MPYTWPLPEGTPISQPFGANPGGFNPVGGHTGTDFAVPAGTPVRAIGDGEVKWADWANKLPADYRADGSGPNPYWLAPNYGGIVLVIDHGPVVSVCAHLSETKLNPGERVRQGDVVALSGATTNIPGGVGPHLHFEVLPDGWNFQNGTYGRVEPGKFCTAYWTAVSPAAASVSPQGNYLRTVTNEAAYARVAPFSGASPAPAYPDGIGKGAALSVVGYVKGEDPYGKGDDAWYKTASGFYVWANAAGNDISGLPYLGDMSGQKPAPPAAPAPAPAQPTPKYDFALDFPTVTREDGVVITVEKTPAAVGNFASGNGPSKDIVVVHQFGTPGRDTLASTTAQFQKDGTQVSAHFAVSGRTIRQFVSLKDRAYHAAGGNDFFGIETDPNQDEETVKTVRALLLALDAKRGVKLATMLHKNVVGSSTSCGSLIDLTRYDVAYPKPAPAPAPPVGGSPTPTPIPVTTVDEAAIIRAFLARVVEWLVKTFVTAPH